LIQKKKKKKKKKKRNKGRKKEGINYAYLLQGNMISNTGSQHALACPLANEAERTNTSPLSPLINAAQRLNSSESGEIWRIVNFS